MSARAWLAFLAFSAALWPGSGSADDLGLARLAGAVNAPQAREAIARVAYAEAAGQGDAGLAGVVFTILNRVDTGAWGPSVETVVNAHAQFEPVLRAGGDWRALPATTPAQRARIDTILNLALEGRLPDPTGGARYFQNPAIVAQRAKAGTVAPGLVHFGGATPSAVIGDHAFYVATGAARSRPARAPDPYGAAGGDIFVQRPETSPQLGPAEDPASTPLAAAGERGLFVLTDGQVVEDRAVSPTP